MLSARLFLAIYETLGGAMIADFQTRARGLKFGYNEHGAAAVSWSVPCGIFEAFSLYARCRGRHVEISASGHPIWRGRVEDIKITKSGLDFSAYGYQRALSDVPITQMWSVTRTDAWEPVLRSVLATHRPDMYRFETKDGLTMALQRGDTYTTGGSIGGFMYRVPSGASRNIYTVSFDWEITLPTNWLLVIDVYDSSWSLVTTAGLATGNGATQTGSSAPGISAGATVVLKIYNNTGANYTATGETGTQYAKITNVRLKGTSTATVTASEIAATLVAYVSAINPGQISSAASLIQNPGLDLRDEVYEDQTPADILDYLVSLGDNQTPPRQWEWGIDLDQALYLRPRGSGRQWYIDIAEPDIEQTLDALFNNTYAVYQDVGGRAQRSASSSDATSAQAFGLTRIRSVQVQTTNSTQATTHRDAALADMKDPRPRVAVETSALYTSSGTRVHPWMARPGDVITIRNLPPVISADVDRLRTFVLSELEFDTESGVASLTPESPTPSLDVLVAREAAGVVRAPTVLRPPIVVR